MPTQTSKATRIPEAAMVAIIVATIVATSYSWVTSLAMEDPMIAYLSATHCLATFLRKAADDSPVGMLSVYTIQKVASRASHLVAPVSSHF